jgi:putative DNA primase/helicase
MGPAPPRPEVKLTVEQGGRSAPGERIDATAAADAVATGASRGALGRPSFRLESPEPWADPVSGAQLADELALTLRTYLVLPPGGIEAIALWLIHAHAHDATEVSPLLLLTSPVKQCGKTKTLDILSRLVPRALSTSNISPAAIYRTISVHRPDPPPGS